MKNTGEKVSFQGKLLRVFIAETDLWEGRPLYEAIVRSAREGGLAGATVLKGCLGFGHKGQLHAAKLLRLSEDLPVVVEIVDTEENIDGFVPRLDGMIREGLVTFEQVGVVMYRTEKNEGAPRGGGRR